jgi:hypothetical protein
VRASILVALGTVLAVVGTGGLGGGILGGAGFRGRLELGGDERVVLGAEVDLVVEFGRGGPALDLGAGLEPLLALEGLDLLHGYFELMRDPGVGASLTDPGADLVQLWS